MRLGLACLSFLLCALLFFLITYDGGARKIAITFGRDIELKEVSIDLQNLARDGHVQVRKEDAKVNNKLAKKIKGKDHNHMDPELNVFFTPKDLKIGKKMPIYFAQRNASTSPKILPREESDKIPFSSKHLPSLLKFFSFPKHSPQAKAMEYTLKHCEFQAMEGETKFCATSLESLLDSTRQIFGNSCQFSMLSTTHLVNSSVPLQNYTISQVKNMSVPRVIGCHPLPYPYAVFYCHSQQSDTRLFVVMLEGEDGARVKAPAICHMDTSMWNKDHVAFNVLKVEPGTSPVCHFFPPDNLVWVPLPSAL
ncbi:BURP domain-containing protein BNM2A-like [Prosopis cineraria]|uniref:BURP domain-containing protein BNM2A-like n=1 Tax=Prosopis cineraria TaxID=364024 RepID=UPI00240F5DDF|nr:BURP domain-containing protein BNM2A-like [Prosopis cineraria]